MLLFVVVHLAIFVVVLAVVVALELRDYRRRTTPGLYLKGVKNRMARERHAFGPRH
jgi:hypothetical protein